MAYVVMSADRSGNCWEVARYTDALAALTKVEWLRQDYPHNVHMVNDSEDPERGDIQLDLEEIVAEQDPTPPRMQFR